MRSLDSRAGTSVNLGDPLGCDLVWRRRTAVSTRPRARSRVVFALMRLDDSRKLNYGVSQTAASDSLRGCELAMAGNIDKTAAALGPIPAALRVSAEIVG